MVAISRQLPVERLPLRLPKTYKNSAVSLDRDFNPRVAARARVQVRGPRGEFAVMQEDLAHSLSASSCQKTSPHSLQANEALPSSKKETSPDQGRRVRGQSSES